MNGKRKNRTRHLATVALAAFVGVAVAWGDSRDRKDRGAPAKDRGAPANEGLSGVDVLVANRLHELFDRFCGAAAGVQVHYSGPLGRPCGELGLRSRAANANILKWQIVFRSTQNASDRGLLLATITVSETETGDISRGVSIRGRKLYINVAAEVPADKLDRPLSERGGTTARDVMKRLSALKDEELEL